MADMLELIEAFSNFVQNERVRCFNEGVDAERARCARIADQEVVPNRDGDGNAVASVIAEYIRSGGTPQ